MRVKDNNWHEANGKFYPRVTAITGMYPKGHGFEKWLGDMPSYAEAERVKNRAAKVGTTVHDACEQLIAGTELFFTNYTEEEWRKIEGFANFWEAEKPTVRFVEEFLCSDELDVAGTPDLISDKAVIDWKSGNSNQHYGYEIQLDLYRKMTNKKHGTKIKEMWIVQLGGKTKRGYSIKKVKTSAKDLKKDFEVCKHLFHRENGFEPKHKEYRDSIKI